MGFLLKTGAEAAWRHCHNFEHYHAVDEPDEFAYGLVKAAKRRGGAWSVSAAVKVEGPAADSMKVSWMAFAQGVYQTASDDSASPPIVGVKFQVGIAPVVADGEVKTVPLNAKFGSAPIVIAQPIGDATVRQREATATELYFIADGSGETVMVQWIAFEQTDNGYFGSVPFVAGMLDGASGEEKTWPEGEFTQPPLVFASIATDRTDGDVSVRIVNNTPESTVFLQEGTQTDEKVAYLAYNGKGQGGAVVNAETVHIQTYYWHSWGAGTGCARTGLAELVVACYGSWSESVNWVDYDHAYCTAFAGNEEPGTTYPCDGDESAIATEGKCLQIKGLWDLEVVDCTGKAEQRFRMTKKGQLAIATDGRCVSYSNNRVTFDNCAADPLDDQLWYFDDGKIVSGTSDTACLVVDPSSKVNVLVGDCGSTTWEAQEPVYHAKKYGEIESVGSGECFSAIGSTVLVEACAYKTAAHVNGKVVYNPRQMWTLTLDDELKTDDVDLCLTTTGLLEGEWEDAWNKNRPPMKLEVGGADGMEVTDSTYCDGFLVGDYTDGWHPSHSYRLCMDKNNKVSTDGGATGHFAFPTLTMNFAGTVVTASVSSGCDQGKPCKLTWSNGNVWDKKDGSEHASGGHLNGWTLEWQFWNAQPAGYVEKALIFGDWMMWTNGNEWKRVSEPALHMEKCTGAANQKWTIEDGGNMQIKSEQWKNTCVYKTPNGGFSVTSCEDSGSYNTYTGETVTTLGSRKFELKHQPSWVSGS
jgi:hypothetical protein